MSLDLATALRAETPTAPDRLRERVTHMAAAAPPARRALPVGRVLAYGALALTAASCATALVVGIRTAVVYDSTPQASSDRPDGQAVQASKARARQLRAALEAQRSLAPSSIPPVALRSQMRAKAALASPRPAPPADAQARGAGTAPLPAPSHRRAQDVTADLRLLVDDTDDLSGTTQQALRITRRLGGYVLAVQYGTSEPREGTATLRLRIPVSRVQAAVVRFSDLGRILAQQTRIADLQQPLDELTRRIRSLERRAARARGKERERILAEIAYLRGERAEINRRAAFATVALDLTTHEPEKKAAPPGRLDRAVDDASGVLAAELAIGAYALIVASPFLVLLAAAYAASRAYRRHADQRLLERA